MKKIHMVTWCPVRMSYLLSPCKLTVDNLIVICDVLISVDIKKEERAYIMGPQSMIILHILGYLESEFGKSYLIKLDTDDVLISEAYYTSIKFSDNLKSEFKTTLLNKFLNGVEEDEHGNLICNLTTPNGNQHKIKLNYSHCPVRHQEAVLSKVDQIMEAAQLRKEKIVTNLVDNIADQSQIGTAVEYASLFDFNNPIDLETRVEYLKELHAIYCISYNHTVPQNEDDESNFKGYITTIKIKYEPKIDCTQEQIVKQFRSM